MYAVVANTAIKTNNDESVSFELVHNLDEGFLLIVSISEKGSKSAKVKIIGNEEITRFVECAAMLHAFMKHDIDNTRGMLPENQPNKAIPLNVEADSLPEEA